MNDEDSRISQLFTEVFHRIEDFVWKEIERETKEKKLYYHTTVHACRVKRIANTIFQAIKPVLLNKIEPLELSRTQNLINICAIAHDMVQEFSYPDQAHTSRKRPLGISETATIDKLINYIKQINQDLSQANFQHSAIFTDIDIHTIKEAIKATICHYDYSGNFVYQPYLYQSGKNLSITARIIALADLGTLGMEGIKAYLQEGVLIFLEENPDLVEFILVQKNRKLSKTLSINTLVEAEKISNLRERLLKSTRFMVNFAQGRKANFEQEIASFNEEIRDILRDRVFKYLTDENIQKIESIVPTDENTTLTELLDFFNFDRYV